MIHTVADLLKALLSDRTAGLGDLSFIKQPGIVGEMYEGLTSEILENACLAGLDLQVASGLIIDELDAESNEVDCMICVGSGKQIGNTRRRIYRPEDVIMIVEVKKTLLGDSMKEALLLFRSYFLKIRRSKESRLPQLERKSWSFLTGEAWPRDVKAIRGLIPYLAHHCLRAEARMPARVVFGHRGYKGEKQLREGCENALNRIGLIPMKDALGGDINTLPNLIICGDAYLVKCDGFPYPGVYSQREESWCWYGSHSGKPLLALLEILWTRLQARFDLSSNIFGKDLLQETISGFASVRAVDGVDGKKVLLHRFHPIRKREGANASISWEPAVLTPPEVIVVSQLLDGRRVNIHDATFQGMLAEYQVTEDELIRSLAEKELVGRGGEELVLLPDDCLLVQLADGRFVAAENNSGRLSAYVLEQEKAFLARRVNEVGKAARLSS